MKAFIDIDTQIDFVFPAGALYGAGGETVIGPVAKLNAYAAANRIPLISTTCAHPEDSREFTVFPPHCIVDTFGQQKPAATLLPKRVTMPNRVVSLEVKGFDQIVVQKDDLDMFTNPNIHALLETLKIDECFVYGVFTEFCIQCAVMGLLKTGRKVHLVTEATAAVSPAAGADAIKAFEAAGGVCLPLLSVLSGQ